MAPPSPRFPSARGVAAVAPLRAARSPMIARAPSSYLSPSSPGHFSWLLLFGPAKRSDPDAGRRSEARRRRAPWRKASIRERVIRTPTGSGHPAADEHSGGRPPAKRGEPDAGTRSEARRRRAPSRERFSSAKPQQPRALARLVSSESEPIRSRRQSSRSETLRQGSQIDSRRHTSARLECLGECGGIARTWMRSIERRGAA